MYTANPELDAVRHADEQDSISSAHEFVCARLHQALTQDVMRATQLAEVRPPYRAWTGGTQHMTALDAIEESLDDYRVTPALVAVLQKSTCHLVAELREAIAQQYIQAHAHKLEPGDMQ